MTPPLVSVEDASRVLREALRCGGHWAEIFVERRDNHTLRLDGGAVAEIRSDRDIGAGIRVVAGGHTGFASTNVLSRATLLDGAQAAVAATMTGESSGHGPDQVDLRARVAPDVQRAVQTATEVETAEMIELLRRFDAAARARSRFVDNVTVTHVAVTQSVAVATTDGLFITDKRVRARLTCRVAARRDGRLETGFCRPGAGTGIELYQERSPESIGSQAAQRRGRTRRLVAATVPRPTVAVWTAAATSAAGHTSPSLRSWVDGSLSSSPRSRTGSRRLARLDRRRDV